MKQRIALLICLLTLVLAACGDYATLEGRVVSEPKPVQDRVGVMIYITKSSDSVYEEREWPIELGAEAIQLKIGDRVKLGCDQSTDNALSGCRLLEYNPPE